MDVRGSYAYEYYCIIAFGNRTVIIVVVFIADFGLIVRPGEIADEDNQHSTIRSASSECLVSCSFCQNTHRCTEQ